MENGVRNGGDTILEVRDLKKHFQVGTKGVVFGIGASLMGALTFLRYRFSWWPIHPIGLAVAAADNVYSLAMPVFMAWAAKTVVMRVGGVALYRRSKPLFLGLLVGYTAGVVLAFTVDAVWFPGQGHQVHWW